MVGIRCRTAADELRAINAPEGVSLMQALKTAGLDIEAACGGNLACGTCHVVLDADWYPLVPSPDEDEQTMLDSLVGAGTTSRLACQILLWDDLDGLTVRIAR